VIALLNKEPDATTEKRVHEARKQLKQLRAILKLVEPEVGHQHCNKADHRLRDVGRSLTPLRDTTVLLATLQRLHRQGHLDSASLARLRAILKSRAESTCAQVLATARRRGALTRPLRKTQRRIAHWFFPHRGWKAIDVGLAQTYQAGRVAATAAMNEYSDTWLHESRKRAKDYFYVLEFLRKARPAAKQRQTLQQQSRAAALATYAKDADAFMTEMHQYWKGWR
jgi:CHAD domain-containing protein